MQRQLNIAGKNSSDIYTLFYPNNLMNFCRYDFTLFLEHCTDLCRLAARTGEYNVEDVYSIRNSISGCHKYYEQNMRTVFEKVVVDCWIDYLCKQSEVSVNTLWQSFIKCRNSFEKAIFGRLSDYRYNRAINEWANLLRMQDYARTKVDFVFGVQITSPQQAVARANYFDLLFNVAANEQGFPVAEIAATGIYSAGRLPNSPFVMNSAAREIARNQLSGIEYRDNYKTRKNPDLTDKIAMDAFSSIKNYIPDKNDSMAKTIIKSLTSAPRKIYMPCSFKAVIDLEIDAAAQSGAYLQRCARCGDYYIRDEEYDFDYCSRPQREGGTCLDIMKFDDPELAEKVTVTAAAIEEEKHSDDEDPQIIYVDKDTVNSKMNDLYKEMAARVNVDLTQRDFSRWYQEELRLKDNILLGEAGEKELNKFIELSRGDAFASRKQPPVIPENPDPGSENEEEFTENGKSVKKFVFEKIDRESVTAPISSSQSLASTLAESEKAAIEAVRKLVEADQSKQREKAQISAPQPVVRPIINHQQYDPAGMQSYSYPSLFQQTAAHPVPAPTPVPAQAPVPAPTPAPAQNPYQQMQGGFAAARQGYGNVMQFGGQQQYPAANGVQFSQFMQRAQTGSRIIKGGTAANQQEYTSKPRTVVIPNGDKERPTERQQAVQKENRAPVREKAISEPEKNEFKETPVSQDKYKDPGTRSIMNAYGLRDDDPMMEVEEDVKVFTPRRNNIFRTSQKDEYIEPSPYEKLKQSIEEYRNDDYAEEEEAEEVVGQISAEEIVRPTTPAPASAVAAYRGYNAGQREPEKAEFSHILDGITRNDGFTREENLVDSDGLPVSHKTKHVMDALFGPTKASPLLRARLEENDDDI